MGYAQKETKEKPIHFGSLLESEGSNTSSPRPQQDPQQRQMQANMITMSKQVERLMDSTQKLLHRPSEKEAFPWNYLLISVGAMALIGVGTFLILQKQHHQLSSTLDQKLTQNKIFTQELVHEKTSALSKDINRIEANIEQDQQFTLTKFKDINQKMIQLDQKYRENNTILNQQKKQIADITEQMVTLKLSQTQNLAKELPIKEEKSLQNKLNHWEFEQATSKGRARSFLDRYQSEQKTAPALIRDESFLEEKNKRFADAYTKLAWSETQKGNFQKAVSSYQKAIRLNPTLGTAYYNLACLYAKNGHRSEAIQWLKDGRPYFSQNLIDTSFQDKDLTSIRRDPEFRSIMFS